MTKNSNIVTLLAAVLAGMVVVSPIVASASRLGDRSYYKVDGHKARALSGQTGEVHVVPFDIGAFQYSSFIDSAAKFGNCPDSEYPAIDYDKVMDGKVVSDQVCINRGAGCYIGWTEGGVDREEVEYTVEVDHDMLVDFTFRLASRRHKDVEVQFIQDGVTTSYDIEAPGAGVETFEDVVVKNIVAHTGSYLYVKVVFTDGGTNLCSISAKESGLLSVPFNAGAFSFTDYVYESTADHFGDCETHSPVDGKMFDDEVCIIRGGACAVAFTEPNEELEYTIGIAEDGTVVDPVFRLSSLNPKQVTVEIENVLDTMTFSTEDGDDFELYYDYRWSRFTGSPVTLDARTYKVNIKFLEGAVNLCSISFPLAPNLVIPFHANALGNYYSAEGTTPTNNVATSCDVSNPVGSKTTTDATCIARSSARVDDVEDGCYVGFTDAGETLSYTIESRGERTVNIILRMASNSHRPVKVSLNGGHIGDLTAPGNGWGSFSDETISNVDLSMGFHTIDVKFEEGFVNLCTISVEIV